MNIIDWIIVGGAILLSIWSWRRVLRLIYLSDSDELRKDWGNLFSNITVTTLVFWMYPPIFIGKQCANIFLYITARCSGRTSIDAEDLTLLLISKTRAEKKAKRLAKS